MATILLFLSLSIVSKNEHSGLYKAHEMRLGLCSRSGDVVEPLLKPQWFVSLKRMASIADEVVRSGQVAIQPAWQKAAWHRWLDDAPDCEFTRVL